MPAREVSGWQTKHSRAGFAGLRVHTCQTRIRLAPLRNRSPTQPPAVACHDALTGTACRSRALIWSIRSRGILTRTDRRVLSRRRSETQPVNAGPHPVPVRRKRCGTINRGWSRDSPGVWEDLFHRHNPRGSSRQARGIRAFRSRPPRAALCRRLVTITTAVYARPLPGTSRRCHESAHVIRFLPLLC